MLSPNNPDSLLYHLITYITLFVISYIILLGILLYMRFFLDQAMSNGFMFKLPLGISSGLTLIIIVHDLFEAVSKIFGRLKKKK